MNEQIGLSATIIKHNGKNALMLKLIVTRPEDIRPIVERIISDGQYEFNGVVTFAHKLNSIARLMRANLI